MGAPLSKGLHTVCASRLTTHCHGLNCHVGGGTRALALGAFSNTFVRLRLMRIKQRHACPAHCSLSRPSNAEYFSAQHTLGSPSPLLAVTALERRIVQRAAHAGVAHLTARCHGLRTPNRSARSTRWRRPSHCSLSRPSNAESFSAQHTLASSSSLLAVTALERRVVQRAAHAGLVVPGVHADGVPRGQVPQARAAVRGGRDQVGCIHREDAVPHPSLVPCATRTCMSPPPTSNGTGLSVVEQATRILLVTWSSIRSQVAVERERCASC